MADCNTRARGRALGRALSLGGLLGLPCAVLACASSEELAPLVDGGGGPEFDAMNDVGASPEQPDQSVDTGLTSTADNFVEPDAGTSDGGDDGAESSTTGDDAGDAGADGAADAGQDAPVESGIDANVETGSDAGVESGADAGRDTGADAGADARLDTGSDAPAEAADQRPPCATAYNSVDCDGYALGMVISSGGHNWFCSDGNCANCGVVSTCAPGKTGCPWGTVWTDQGPCR
jgi:hypothetical protein